MTKLCLIKTTKTVPELYGLSGPFYDPVELSTEQIISMLNRGVLVYEVNPANRSEKIQLNRFLANRVNFKPVAAKEKAQTFVKKEENLSVKSVNPTVENNRRRDNRLNNHQGKDPSRVKVADFN